MNSSLETTSQTLSLGALYRFDEKSHLRTKIDSNAIFSLAFSQQLSPRVNFTLAGEVDTKDWAADSHKFGMALKLNM